MCVYKVYICDTYRQIRDKTKLRRESPSRSQRYPEKLIFMTGWNPMAKIDQRAISTQWRNLRDDRRNLSLATGTLYDLLNARSDPT